MSQRDLLFELGCEELPANVLRGMATVLHDTLIAGLNDSGLTFDRSRWFATPRRLAVSVEGLAATAADIEREILGPPMKAAKDSDGNWTAAALGFAGKQGVSVDALQTIDSDKGPRLGIRRTDPGATAAKSVPPLVTSAVEAIPISKRMRWGRERHEFLRPVQWLVLLLDDEVLPLSLFGLQSGNITFGHRFHQPGPLTIAQARDYEALLDDASVVADMDRRRELIRQQVSALPAAGCEAVIDPDLLDEVTGLVEWPQALRGSFDPDFLKVPSAALISSMKVHQKYFHVVTADGALAPEFITVANVTSSDPNAVVAGNERVIRPRLADAAFFFETDKQLPLAHRVERLDSVVFQQQLGSIADKQARVSELAGRIAEHLDADVGVVAAASQLAKCDLVSELVLEFPELQGIAGAHYARNDGLPESVARVIEQHYWPRFAGDALPESVEAAALALADRIDTLVGIFGIGQRPTGSKDPFALRRASLAVIRILIDHNSDVTLKALADAAVQTYPAGIIAAGTADAAVDYLIDRLPAWYEEQDIPIAVLRSVTATGITSPRDIDARVRALHTFAATDAVQALAATNKRVANILAKSDQAASGRADPQLFDSVAEQTLFDQLQHSEAALVPQLAASDYFSALETLAQLRPPVDDFFDQVMVNTDDDAVRQNRLRLLSTLRGQFMRVADIAHLAMSA